MNLIDPRKTEHPHPDHADLDTYSTEALVQAFVDDQLQALVAVQAAGPQLALAVQAALPRLQAGGRLIYAGAGTSGRLAVLDAVELPPTFSWPSERAVGLLAGGEGAMYRAVEGAEDSPALGAADLAALRPGPDDVVLLISASGTAPYVRGVLDAAVAAGCLTIGLVNNPDMPVATRAEIGIVLDTGPEVISGSTRLKAGTAQKIALNTLSSALMVKLHKVHGNLMVDLQASNQKLQRRALRMTCLASDAEEADAQAALDAAGGNVKCAIVMLLAGLEAPEARRRLDAAGGSVRGALAWQAPGT
jgi:N-acetylmuramic acid 6-phosphate etherase